MTRDDIIRMAREAQMPFYWATGEIPYLGRLERFAALVAVAAKAEENKACANICEMRFLASNDEKELMTYNLTRRSIQQDILARMNE